MRSHCSPNGKTVYTEVGFYNIGLSLLEIRQTEGQVFGEQELVLASSPLLPFKIYYLKIGNMTNQRVKLKSNKKAYPALLMFIMTTNLYCT